VAHLSIEYSANLEKRVDMAAFCEVARAAMAASGLYPVAGIRVRAFRADFVALGDGGDDLGFADLVLRQGPGRSEAEKERALEAIYSALESWWHGQSDAPFALSMELLEIKTPFAVKRLNTVRPALSARGVADA
jgi:5-carboxymethyl-2-hydroxymuconate isomerase